MWESPLCHSTEGFIASPMRALQAEVDPLRDICTTMPRAKRYTLQHMQDPFKSHNWTRTGGKQCSSSLCNCR